MDAYLQVGVPAQLRDPHSAVAALRDDKRHFPLTGAARSRALRILQALVVAAEDRGWTAGNIEYGNNVYEHRGSNDHLVIDAGATKVRVRMFQQTDRTPHTPSAHDLDQQQRWGTRPPKYDHSPNDLLRIQLDSSWDGSQHSWSEGTRGSLEGKLAAVISEIERRNAAVEARQVQQEMKDAERRRQHQAMAEEAKQMLREQNRADVLAAQVSAWAYARQLREYITEMQRAAEADADPEARKTALEWVGWAKRHAEDIDPLRRNLAAPADPEPTAEALAPFLRQGA